MVKPFETFIDWTLAQDQKARHFGEIIYQIQSEN